ncbi:MAG: acyl carrier protein [Lachnospiraceae bacterium]|nr:acyl carrier protein [Lachnospiraceae bacterium]
MNLKKYNEIFIDLFGVDESELGSGFNFGVVKGWDSYAHMELIAKIEDTYEIMMDTYDITHFGGYENGKKILKKYGIEI